MSGEIKLEVGQRVRLRNGKICKVELPSKPFSVGSFLMSQDGKIFDDGRDDDWNVVEILPPEPATPTVELGKWYPCRDGVHEGKVLEGGFPGISPWVGVVRRKSEHASWFPTAWTTQGKSSGIRDESDCDLMLAPPEPKRHKITFWANCYQDEDGTYIYVGRHKTKADADKSASKEARLACVPYTIEFVEGEGLS